jgi:hypothetical protein
LFLYSYEADFIQGLLKKNEKKLARFFNFTFRYIDDVFSLNNSRFGDFVDRIYPIELEIKDTTDTDRSASYLDLHLEIDSEGRLRMKLNDKRDDFNFPIASSNPAHGEVYLIQHYVIKFVSDLRQVSGFLQVLRFSSINKTDGHDITEILLKVPLSTITLFIS